MASAVVSVRNLRKHFRRAGNEVVSAVDDVSFDVHPGEFMVLLGPSGCGKTTLLRCIAGLEQPDEGTISIRGKHMFSSQDLINVPAERRRISMVFQSYALWPHLNVYDNIAYPLRTNRANRVPRKELAERVREVMATTGIEGLEKQYPNQISGGQQQRVALCRALMAGSDLVLFDEPLSNVDAKVREQLRIQLLTIQRKLGFAALFVTHDRQEAMAIASSIAVLDGGKLAQLGSPQEIYDRPATRYVADFIGPINEVEGIVNVADGDVHEAVGPIGPVFGRLSAADKSIGDSVAAVWRPESSVVSRVEPATQNRWSGVVEHSCYFGSYMEYMVRVGDQLLRSHMSRAQVIEIGTTAWISVDAADVTLL
jgi:iron(III) transport system ATP-binding protein